MTSDATIPHARRRPKGDKRVRTRAKILEAARDLIREKGYEHTTVQEVARRAGLSNGAVYGNFKNRDDLFAAIGPAYWPRVTVRVEPGSDFATIMRAVAEATIAALPDRRRAAPGRLIGLAYALANQGLQARGEEIATAGYAAAVDWWRRTVPDQDQLPMPPEVLVRVLGALIEGLTFQRLLTPNLIPDSVIHAAFAALAAGTPPAQPEPPT
ncbi:MAG: helix-turn-helix domain-containing protein [Phenylobacterium sp.]